MDNYNAEYWETHSAVSQFACPTTALYRFLGALKKPINGARVLEVGFGHGADLLEMKRRGADIYGVDINQASVDYMQTITGDREKFILVDASSSPIPFAGPFNIITCFDTLYYFAYPEIEAFFAGVREMLANDGVFVFQFIQSDFTNNNPSGFHDFQRMERLTCNFGSVENPIAFLDPERLEAAILKAGLKVAGTKVLIESYDMQESLIRYNKYYACTRA